MTTVYDRRITCRGHELRVTYDGSHARVDHGGALVADSARRFALDGNGRERSVPAALLQPLRTASDGPEPAELPRREAGPEAVDESEAETSDD